MHLDSTAAAREEASVDAPQAEVRVAETALDRELVFRLRYEIYVAEMNIFSAVADHAQGRLTDAHDEAAELLLACVDGEPAGTMRLTFGSGGPFAEEFLATYGLDAFASAVPREAMLVLTRFMVRKTHRGSSVPFDLISQAARIAAARGIALAFCDCAPHLINLYSLLGFRTYRRTYNDPQTGLKVPMVLIAGDTDHLRRVGSPLTGVVSSEDLPVTEAARRAVGVLPVRSPVRSLEHVQAYDWSEEIAEGLRGQALRLFKGLDDAQLAGVLAHSHIIDVSPGDHLIRGGQVTRTMYVLLGGELEYGLGSGPRGAQIGDVVGEVAFLLRSTRTIDVTAGPSGARVLSLHEPSLRGVMQSHSQAAAGLLLNLCRMLAERIAARR